MSWGLLRWPVVVLAATAIVPMAFAPGDSLNSHSNYFLRMVGRLRSDVTKEQAAADLNRLLQGIVASESINQTSALDLTSLHVFDKASGRSLRG